MTTQGETTNCRRAGRVIPLFKYGHKCVYTHRHAWGCTEKDSRRIDAKAYACIYTHACGAGEKDPLFLFFTLYTPGLLTTFLIYCLCDLKL